MTSLYETAEITVTDDNIQLKLYSNQDPIHYHSQVSTLVKQTMIQASQPCSSGMFCTFFFSRTTNKLKLIDLLTSIKKLIEERRSNHADLEYRNKALEDELNRVVQCK